MKKQRNIFMYLWAALLLAHKSLDGREEQEQPLRSLIEEAYQQQKKITTQLLSSIEEKTKEQEAQVLHKTEMLNI